MIKTGCAANSSRASLGILGWLVSWTYALSFIPIFTTSASQYSDDAWLVSLFSAFSIGAFSLGLIYAGGGQPFWTRLLALPHILIFSIGFGVIHQAFSGATISGHHLAAIALGVPDQTDIATPFWHRLYALVHVSFFASAAFLAFRPVIHQTTSASSIHPASA